MDLSTLTVKPVTNEELAQEINRELGGKDGVVLVRYPLPSTAAAYVL